MSYVSHLSRYEQLYSYTSSFFLRKYVLIPIFCSKRRPRLSLHKLSFIAKRNLFFNASNKLFSAEYHKLVRSAVCSFNDCKRKCDPVLHFHRPDITVRDLYVSQPFFNRRFLTYKTKTFSVGISRASVQSVII